MRPEIGEYRCLVLLDSSVEDIYYVVIGDDLFPLVLIINPQEPMYIYTIYR